MKIKAFLISFCLLFTCLVMVGCDGSLKDADFVREYNSLSNATQITKEVSCWVDDEKLFDKQVLSKGALDGYPIVSLFKSSKTLNEISMENAVKIKEQSSLQYFYQDKIGTLLENGGIEWRDGLIEELTGQWSVVKNEVLNTAYLSEVYINQTDFSLRANVKNEFVKAIFGQKAKDGNIEIQLNENKILNKIIYRYNYNETLITITIDVSFEDVVIAF